MHYGRDASRLSFCDIKDLLLKSITDNIMLFILGLRSCPVYFTVHTLTM
jgi:hypothetical protein